MNIRDLALGDARNMEAALAASIKAAQSASAALEALTVSLMLAATFLNPPEPFDDESTECRHLQTLNISTMGRNSELCEECGVVLGDAMHQ